jgi:hypothetical protein
MTWAWLRIEDFFFSRVDPRPYALVRICFAFVSLLNLITLWPDRLIFFSDAGMIDGPALRESYPGPYLSIYYWLDTPEFVTASFLVAALAMVCLGLGIGTRLAAFVIWVFLSSYIARGFPVIHGWDILQRIVAFILLISPADRCWSLGNWWRGKHAIPAADVPRYGLILLQVQLAVVYWQTVWLKIKDETWRNGEFIAYFMRSMYSRFPDWPWENWELLSNALTYGALAIEAAVPLLLWSRRYRWWGFALGWGLHIGIWSMSSLWLFSLVIMFPYFAFLERADFEKLGRWLRIRRLD